MSFDTPILLIVFNRPEKTRRLFEIIKKIKEEYLIQEIELKISKNKILDSTDFVGVILKR